VSPSLRPIDAAERRARLAVRHRLAATAQAGDVVDVAGDLVALHATDPASVYLAAAARMRAPTVRAVERALYDDRSLVRLLGMRRTMFVVPLDLVPTIHAACTRAIAATERRKLVAQIAAAGVLPAGTEEAWLDRVGDETVAALERRGEALAAELAADVPDLATEMRLGPEGKWTQTQRVTNRVLSVLAADERIVRGRPRGSWTSSQYRWAPLSKWIAVDRDPPDRATAQADLARRWLGAFGPGTIADLTWWAGWTVTATRAAVAAVDAVEVDLDGTPGFVLPDDLEPVAVPEPAATLLPALDPTPMGWSGRDWYLGAHRPLLFDRSGNIGPSVWWDGRVVGGWAQRRDGEVAYRLLEDVGAEATRAVEAAAHQLTGWLGPARVACRFHTPLERSLTE
jgi:DNA glycosylase AlkZ-like